MPAAGASAVRATGSTVRDVVADLDRQFPGLRFRMVDEQERLRIEEQRKADAAARTLG